MAAGQTYIGAVKSFSPSKGWGFVECLELGSDVFLLKNELRGYSVFKGDLLSFQVTQSARGVQAANVTLVQAAAADAQCYFGEVKTFNQQRGFGFITSPATQQLFGKDVFVMKSDFPNGVVLPGFQVQFKAKMGERGPVATKVQFLGAPMQAQWASGLWPQQWGASGGEQQRWGMAQWGGPQPWAAAAWTAGAGAGGAATRRAPSEQVVFFGTLKQVNAEKGWGHIACEALLKTYGKDMFVLRSSLEGASLQPGQQVAFTVTQGPKGPHAENLRPLVLPGPGELFTGVVKSYNETKGWGFIESTAVRELLQTDVFLHRRESSGTEPKSGDTLAFAVDVSGGRAAAKGARLAVAEKEPGAAPPAPVAAGPVEPAEEEEPAALPPPGC